MGHGDTTMFKAVLASLLVASASAAGGLNISSLSVNAPKGHTAKVQLGGGNASSYKIGITSEAEFAIIQGESKLVDIEQDGSVHVTTKQFAGGEVKKTFEGLPAHTSVKLVATFHFIDAWEGEYAYARIDDNYVWTDTYTQDASSQSINVCGNDKIGEGKFTVPIEVSVPHTSNKVKISFGSTIDQDPADESWGLSSVAVYIK